MPLGDRTGPAGLGPMTGRGAGYCAGYSVPGYMNPIPGRGFFGRGRGGGFGRGGGRGWGRGYFAGGFPGSGYYGAPAYPYSPELNPYPSKLKPEEEVNLLKEDAKVLKQQLDDIQGHIDTLEKGKSKGKK